MARTGPGKQVDANHGDQRLRIARDYHEAAEERRAMLDPGDGGNAIVSNVVTAAIAYADAITAKRIGLINQQDHRGIVKLLRQALGNALPGEQEKRLSQLIANKDAAQYGARIISQDEASRLVDDLQRFAEWAEEVLRE